MSLGISILRELTEHIELSVGDVIVDLVTDYAGTLIKRVRHISIEYDEVYVWEIRWFENRDPNLRPADYLEEEGMKLSIVAGSYEWCSVKKH
jgi:hypothetical protein|tara:strand:+ start:1986 stop:2261 length:276 start_codon:yes stop_codon:yes gene_type:complete